MSELFKLMSLNNILIYRRMFPKDGESPYTGKVTFDGDQGSVTVNLNADETSALVLAVADALKSAGEQAAARLRDAVLTSVKAVEVSTKKALP